MKTIIICMFIVSLSVLCSQSTDAQLVCIGSHACITTDNANVKSGKGFDIDFSLLKAIRISVGRYTADTKVGDLSEGDYSLIWVEVSATPHLMVGIFEPYLGIGPGYYITSHELSARVNDALARRGLRAIEDIHDGIGTNLVGGLGILVSTTILVDVQVKYVSFGADTDFEATNLTTSKSSSTTMPLDLSTVFFGLGVSVQL